MKDKLSTPIYASDLKEQYLQDGFIKGIEAKIKEAEKEGLEVVVGYFLNEPKIG